MKQRNVRQLLLCQTSISRLLSSKASFAVFLAARLKDLAIRSLAPKEPLGLACFLCVCRTDWLRLFNDAKEAPSIIRSFTAIPPRLAKWLLCQNFRLVFLSIGPYVGQLQYSANFRRCLLLCLAHQILICSLLDEPTTTHTFELYPRNGRAALRISIYKPLIPVLKRCCL
ncbi:uncharacterized protein TrAtP1_002352 [Trichoderma atroviride]|uniref:uncharacterized protein n=1 Tax=Hypocrea atroviridis TaxID=63577 RepID=UPI0033323A22|nr:hypothetical protein TrAtP1_002352 [Trichoderma atroviride]